MREHIDTTSLIILTSSLVALTLCGGCVSSVDRFHNHTLDINIMRVEVGERSVIINTKVENNNRCDAHINLFAFETAISMIMLHDNKKRLWQVNPLLGSSNVSPGNTSVIIKAGTSQDRVVNVRTRIRPFRLLNEELISKAEELHLESPVIVVAYGVLNDVETRERYIYCNAKMVDIMRLNE